MLSDDDDEGECENHETVDGWCSAVRHYYVPAPIGRRH